MLNKYTSDYATDQLALIACCSIVYRDERCGEIIFNAVHEIAKNGKHARGL